MKNNITLFFILAIFGISCSKEVSNYVNKDDQPQVDLIIEGSEDDPEISEVTANEHGLYVFGGVRGLYFGCKSIFKIKGDATIEIRLGTELTANTLITDSDFVQLIQPGSRVFGSLGAYTTYPQLLNDKVEISYTDKKSKRWCSTRITEKLQGGEIFTYIRLDQPDGVFVIDDIHKVEIGPEKEGYRIRGHFDCILYEVSGEAKMKIRGKFHGMVSSEN